MDLNELMDLLEWQTQRVTDLQIEIEEERATDMELCSAIEGLSSLYDTYLKAKVDEELTDAFELIGSVNTEGTSNFSSVIIDGDIIEEDIFMSLGKPLFSHQVETVEKPKEVTESEIIINKALDYYNESIKKVRNEVFSIRTMSEEEFQAYLIENNL